LYEEACDLAKVVTASIRFVLDQARGKGLVINRRLAAGLPQLKADRRLLKQILLNLLSNAVKFTPEGGSITVTAETGDDGGLRIVVADTGIGMAREDISRALEPFEQIESAFSRRHKGSGLGLPLAKALTELHGGSLRLESEAGEGTTVTVSLPGERSIIQDERSDIRSA
jgi:signal transduction histidine kinase